ncbi:hypothetical protein NMY22_g7025 [Coprinellus aureogranulatus]|nr:hypothetical protein NMY22_g7025 [Coprinellus aureogranulatus]
MMFRAAIATMAQRPFGCGNLSTTPKTFDGQQVNAVRVSREARRRWIVAGQSEPNKNQGCRSRQRFQDSCPHHPSLSFSVQCASSTLLRLYSVNPIADDRKLRRLVPALQRPMLSGEEPCGGQDVQKPISIPKMRLGTSASALSWKDEDSGLYKELPETPGSRRIALQPPSFSIRTYPTSTKTQFITFSTYYHAFLTDSGNRRFASSFPRLVFTAPLVPFTLGSLPPLSAVPPFIQEEFGVEARRAATIYISRRASSPTQCPTGDCGPAEAPVERRGSHYRLGILRLHHPGGSADAKTEAFSPPLASGSSASGVSVAKIDVCTTQSVDERSHGGVTMINCPFA